MGPLFREHAWKRLQGRHLFLVLFSAVFLLSCAFVVISPCKQISWSSPAIKTSITSESVQPSVTSACQTSCKTLGTETLPRGIISRESDLEMQQLWGKFTQKANKKLSKNLLAVPVGIKQKETVDKLVRKFIANNFTIMLFHYDGVVDQWRNLPWSDAAIHISAMNQTKWWFAKRFLHPDIVSEYNYIFLWDEDLEVDNFHPGRYLSIIQEEGLEISQPALDAAKSEVHHQITIRSRRTRVHRRTYKFTGGTRCFGNSTHPPCTGWVEMMAPVYSQASWRCTWHMIQNDLIHAWGLDMKLGYCAQGDWTMKVGVVDAEYIVHKGIPSLGAIDAKKLNETATPSKGKNRRRPSLDGRPGVRWRSYNELEIFKKRWRKAVAEDKCWIDPYNRTTNAYKS